MDLVATVDVDHGHPTVVAISGDLDLASAPTLEGVLALPNIRRAPNLVLDLTGVTFMDCAGLGILIGARKRIALGPVRSLTLAPRGARPTRAAGGRAAGSSRGRARPAALRPGLGCCDQGHA